MATILDFQREFVETGDIEFYGDFKEHVLRINKQEPSLEFARTYIEDSRRFVEAVASYRVTEKVAVEK
jgi:sulfite reductase (ferredoxin)